MQRQTTDSVNQAICFIEENLSGKLELKDVARELHYSPYHLHRMFTRTVGLTIHDYTMRRRLTEAARQLVDSQRSILEIAMDSGYESQQAFTGVFKALYKTTPDRFRKVGNFYPLQLEMHLERMPEKRKFSRQEIRPASLEDMKEWMELVYLVIDGYPCMEESAYRKDLKQRILKGEALVLQENRRLIGAMGISHETASIEFLAVHPQYRGREIPSVFLEKLTEELFRGKEISTTTFREGDRADTGYRKEWKHLGFVSRELLVEYGYPTQRMTLPPNQEEMICRNK